MSKKLVLMTNKEIKRKSKCAKYMGNKSFFDRIKHKSKVEIILSQFSDQLIS